MEHELNLEHRLTECEQRGRSNTKRLDEMEKRQDDLETLTSSVALMASKQERMETDVQEIKADVKTMKDKPGRRWDTMVDKLVWAVLAAVITFLLGQIGL